MNKYLSGLILFGFACVPVRAATDFACMNDCAAKGYLHQYCTSVCSYPDTQPAQPGAFGTFDLGRVLQQAEQIKAMRAQREAFEAQQRALEEQRAAQRKEAAAFDVDPAALRALQMDRDAALAAESTVTDAEALKRIKARCLGWPIVPGALLPGAEIAIRRTEYQCIYNAIEGWKIAQESAQPTAQKSPD